FQNTYQEEAWIFQEIKKRYQNKEDLSKLAIIYKEHKQIANLVRLFEQEKIPMRIKENMDILRLPFAEKILNILRYLLAEFNGEAKKADNYLFQILHYDFWRISAKDIAELSRTMASKRTEMSWRLFLTEDENLDNLKLQDILNLKKLILDLTRLVQEIPNYTVPDFFSIMIKEMGILAYVVQSEEQVFYMRILTSLNNFIKEENLRRKYFKLSDLVQVIEQMLENGISLAIEKVVNMPQGVHLLTAHSSKGLEFDTVFLIGLQSSSWDKAKGGMNNFAYPDTLLANALHHDMEEIRRLFYVALTRGKSELHLSYAKHNYQDKESEASQLVEEIRSSAYLNFMDHQESDLNELVNQQITLLSPRQVWVGEENSLVAEKIQNFVLNPTALNKYLRCPTAFYYENILQVPFPPNDSMDFGTAIHESLHHILQSFKDGEEISVQKLNNFFIHEMKKLENHFRPEQFQKRIEYGQKILTAYYEKYHTEFHQNIELEFPNYRGSLGEIPLSGKIDKIEILENNKIRVVDYKTGSYKPKNMYRPKGEDLGGDYWRQLVFYKILLEQKPQYAGKDLVGMIDYIEPFNGEFKRDLLEITLPDIMALEEQIRQTYAKIQNADFSGACHDCTWCKFKENLN
nr:PD-(D/E)XK nuclease family protein [Candidatus Gracilibacteria bacterium]